MGIYFVNKLNFIKYKMKGSFAILALVGNISAVNLKKTNMV